MMCTPYVPKYRTLSTKSQNIRKLVVRSIKLGNSWYCYTFILQDRELIIVTKKWCKLIKDMLVTK